MTDTKAKPTTQEQIENANGPLRTAVHDALQINYDKIRALSNQIRLDEAKEHQEISALQEAIQNEINLNQFIGSSFFFYYLKSTGVGKEPIVKLYALGNHYSLSTGDHNTLHSGIHSVPPYVFFGPKGEYRLEWMSQGINRFPSLIHPGPDRERGSKGDRIITSICSFGGKVVFIAGGFVYIVKKLSNIQEGLHQDSSTFFKQVDGLPFLFVTSSDVSTQKGIFLVNAKHFYKTDLGGKLTKVLNIPAGKEVESAAYFQAITLNRLPDKRVTGVIAKGMSIHAVLPNNVPMLKIKKLYGDDLLFTFPQPISYFRDFTVSFHLYLKKSAFNEDTVIVGGHRHLELLYSPVKSGLIIRWNVDGLNSNYEEAPIVLDGVFANSIDKWTAVDVVCKNRTLTVHVQGQPSHENLKLPEAPPQDPLFPYADHFTLGNASHQEAYPFSLMELHFYQRAVRDSLLAQNATAQLACGDYFFPEGLMANYPLGPSNSPIWINSGSSGTPSDFINRVNPLERINIGSKHLEYFNSGEYLEHPFMETFTITSDQNIQSDVHLCNRSGRIFYIAINNSKYCIMMQDICGMIPAKIVAEVDDSKVMEFKWDGSTTEFIEEAMMRKQTKLRLAHFKLERAHEDAHVIIHHEMEYLEGEIEKANDQAHNVAFLRNQYNVEKENWQKLRPEGLNDKYEAIEASIERLKKVRSDAHEVMHAMDVEINELRRLKK